MRGEAFFPSYASPAPVADRFSNYGPGQHSYETGFRCAYDKKPEFGTDAAKATQAAAVSAWQTEIVAATQTAVVAPTQTAVARPPRRSLRRPPSRPARFSSRRVSS